MKEDALFLGGRARNAELWDVEGKRYIDFAGGIAVLNTGHCHPEVIAAVKLQLDLYTHTCFQVVAYKPYLDLAQRLCEMIGAQEHYKAAFFTSGAEAVADRRRRCAGSWRSWNHPFARR